jgi:hypothetical protein
MADDTGKYDGILCPHCRGRIKIPYDPQKDDLETLVLLWWAHDPYQCWTNLRAAKIETE